MAMIIKQSVQVADGPTVTYGLTASSDIGTQSDAVAERSIASFDAGSAPATFSGSANRERGAQKHLS